jgi:hypothetical protein
MAALVQPPTVQNLCRSLHSVLQRGITQHCETVDQKQGCAKELMNGCHTAGQVSLLDARVGGVSMVDLRVPSLTRHGQNDIRT